MTLESDIDILKKVAFFAELPPDSLRLLAFSADSREFADRAVLFEEGELADSGYVIMQGRVDLMRAGDDGRLPLASLGPSTLLGELALIIDTTRPTSAMSVGRSRVMLIRRTTFRRILNEYPAIAAQIHDRLAERLTSMVPEIDRIRRDLDEEV